MENISSDLARPRQAGGGGVTDASPLGDATLPFPVTAHRSRLELLMSKVNGVSVGRETLSVTWKLKSHEQ